MTTKKITLDELLEILVPQERGQFVAYISFPESQFIHNIVDITRLVRDYRLSSTIAFCSNGLNGITIQFDKYVMVNRAYQCFNWGYDYDCFLRICELYPVHVYHPTKLIGYAMDNNGDVHHSFECFDDC